MAKTKETFEQIIDNQNKLAETLTENAQKMMKLFELDSDLEKMSKEATETYMAQSKEYMEELSKAETPEKAWSGMSTAFSKFMEMQTATYNKTTDFYRNMMEKYNWEAGQETFNQATELYRESFKAIYETAGANTKVFQEAFTSEN